MSRRRSGHHEGEPQLFVPDDATAATTPLVDTKARQFITVDGLADTLFIGPAPDQQDQNHRRRS